MNINLLSINFYRGLNMGTNFSSLMRAFPFQIVYKGKETLPFSEQIKKECYFYEISRKKQQVIPIYHHILIVDYEPQEQVGKEQLRERLNKTLNLLCKQGKRYVSVLAYKKDQGLVHILSSVKCDRSSYKMAEVERHVADMVEHIRKGSVSEALQVALKITERLRLCCDGQSITLLTDDTHKALKGEEQQLQMKEPSHNQLIRLWELIDDEKMIEKFILKVEAIYKNVIKIQNDSVFVCEDHRYYSKREIIERRNDREKNLLVTYDQPLQLDCTYIKIKKKEDLAEVIPYYLYHWAAYLLKKGEIEGAESVIAETKDLAAYKKVCNVYSDREKGSVYKQLIQLAENPSKRYKEGKLAIDRALLKKEEPLCLLEVLDMILEDEESKLLWDYSYSYERIGPSYQSQEMVYAFIKPTLGYGEVEKICIGSKKLNVGVQVKVIGQVEELKTHLKLDAVVYREYNLVMNGKLNTTYLVAELSKKVKGQLKDLGIIKLINHQGEKKLYRLQLHQLSLVNKRLIQSVTASQLARDLYELELLKLKENVIKRYLKMHLESRKVTYQKQLKLYEKFHMNEQGIFSIKQDDINGTLPMYTYKARVVEWKIDQFPKKKLEGEFVAEYQLESSILTVKQIKQLQEQLIDIKQAKGLLDHKVQIIRIASVLMEQPIFEWEVVSEKEKKKSLSFIEGNAVVEGKMIVSIVHIEHLAIKQEHYLLWVVHQ